MPIRTSPTIVGNSDPSWLGSAHGTDATQSITLDIAKFVKATHYAKGRIKSGEPLGKLTATGLYAPYKSDASDGTETLAGFLYSDVPVFTGDVSAPAAIFLHGQVKTANLPRSVDEAGKTDVAGHILFR